MNEPDTNKSKDFNNIEKLILAFIAMIVIVFVAIKWADNKGDTPDSTDKSQQALVDESQNKTPQPVDSTVATNEPVTNWQYGNMENKMTSGYDYIATVKSGDILQFDFPYNGGSEVSINIENIEGNNHVFLEVDKGQFIEGEVRIRFDGHKAQSYQGYISGTGNFKKFYLHPAPTIIYKLKHSKRIIVEAPFYEIGDVDFTFDVEGLKWNH